MNQLTQNLSGSERVRRENKSLLLLMGAISSRLYSCLIMANAESINHFGPLMLNVLLHVSYIQALISGGVAFAWGAETVCVQSVARTDSVPAPAWYSRKMFWCPSIKRAKSTNELR